MRLSLQAAVTSGQRLDSAKLQQMSTEELAEYRRVLQDAVKRQRETLEARLAGSPSPPRDAAPVSASPRPARGSGAVVLGGSPVDQHQVRSLPRDPARSRSGSVSSRASSRGHTPRATTLASPPPRTPSASPRDDPLSKARRYAAPLHAAPPAPASTRSPRAGGPSRYAPLTPGGSITPDYKRRATSVPRPQWTVSVAASEDGGGTGPLSVKSSSIDSASGMRPSPRSAVRRAEGRPVSASPATLRGNASQSSFETSLRSSGPPLPSPGKRSSSAVKLAPAPSRARSRTSSASSGGSTTGTADRDASLGPAPSSAALRTVSPHAITRLATPRKRPGSPPTPGGGAPEEPAAGDDVHTQHVRWQIQLRSGGSSGADSPRRSSPAGG
jgi:hypothetical protein